MPLELPPPVLNARTLIYDGLAQTDIDMANYRLLNLDDSNLTLGERPPSVGPVLHKWLKSWNSTTLTWTTTQPAFSDISGTLSTGAGGQQQAITQLGTINTGVWQGTQLVAGKVPRLSGINPPVGPVTMNHHRITDLSDPIDLQDAVNLRYMNALLPGLQIKEAVRCATTAHIALYGHPTIDHVTTGNGHRVLVKNHTNPIFNGIWKVKGINENWERADDSNSAAELTSAYCFVVNGDVNGDTSWVQTEDAPTIGADPIHYVLFNVGGAGPPGPPGPGVPAGGTTLQVLVKASNADYNTAWATALFQPLGSVPTGGDVGQVMVKNGVTDYDTAWDNVGVPTNGTTGNVLVKDTDIAAGCLWLDITAVVIPGGGTTDQVIRKLSDDNFDFEWSTTREVPKTGLAAVGDLLVKDSLADDGYRWVTSPSQVPPGNPPYVGVPGDVLTYLGPEPWDNGWETPSPSGAVFAIEQTGQLNPTGTTDTTGVMMGLNTTITPFVTGKVIITIDGFMSNNGAGSAGAGIRIGTGTPPVHGVAPTGTAYGAAAVCGPLGANVKTPFSLTAAVTGLIAGTPVWIDLHVLSAGSGTATVFAVAISAYEIG